MSLFRLLRPLVHSLDAEAAHRATIAALKLLPARAGVVHDPILASQIAGLAFPSPIGLAAGFDKDAEVPGQMLGLGFGFVEIGSITPLPQAGNPRPRLFRLSEDEGVINRMGFNNRGHDAALRRLGAARGSGVIGVNVGANKDASDRIADFGAGIRRFASVADYLTVNISSPNTPGLRGLQDVGALDALLAAVSEARIAGGPPRSAAAAGSQPAGPPIFLKLAPDLETAEVDAIVKTVAGRVDALIIGNTTVSRPDLKSRFAGETGGLSGRPLAPLARKTLALFASATSGEVPLIAAGGIDSAEEAYARIRGGASLVQIYSAMVYRGPGIAREIAAGLAALLKRDGFASVSEAVGSDLR